MTLNDVISRIDTYFDTGAFVISTDSGRVAHEYHLNDMIILREELSDVKFVGYTPTSVAKFCKTLSSHGADQLNEVRGVEFDKLVYASLIRKFVDDDDGCSYDRHFDILNWIESRQYKTCVLHVSRYADAPYLIGLEPNDMVELMLKFSEFLTTDYSAKISKLRCL